MRFALWILALVLRIGPRHFRCTYGGEIRADFTETVASEYERRGRRGFATAAAGAYVDVCVSGLRERSQSIGRDLVFALRALRVDPVVALRYE